MKIPSLPSDPRSDSSSSSNSCTESHAESYSDQDWLLLFDMDGTLVDSAPDISATLNETLKSEGLGTLGLQVVQAHIGEGLRKILMVSFPHLSPDSPEFAQIEHKFYKSYEEHCVENTHLMEGAWDFLTQWKGPKAIVSNKRQFFLELIVHHLKLDTLDWIALVGGDLLGERKPHPLPLQHVMKLANKSPEQTIMIGDGIPDVRAAKAAGCHSILLDFGYTPVHIIETYRPSAIVREGYGSLREVIEKLRV